MHQNRRGSIRTIAITGITLTMVGLSVLSQGPARAQAPTGAETAQTSAGSYVVVDALSAADLERLLTAIRKVDGVEQAEVKKMARARKAGFELKQTPTRIYLATGPVQRTDLTQLRATLRDLPGVERVEMTSQPGGLALRIRGAIDPSGIAAALKLRTALNQILGVAKIESRVVVGGANLIVYGDVKEEALTKTARACGYGLLSVSDPTGETQCETVTLPSIRSERERITPPEPNERTIDEQTKVGEPAPDFSLLMHDGKGKITLSHSFGKRPVVLIFGSYT